MDYSIKLAKEFTIRQDYALNIIKLIDEGNTISLRYLAIKGIVLPSSISLIMFKAWSCLKLNSFASLIE